MEHEFIIRLVVNVDGGLTGVQVEGAVLQALGEVPGLLFPLFIEGTGENESTISVVDFEAAPPSKCKLSYTA